MSDGSQLRHFARETENNLHVPLNLEAVGQLNFHMLECSGGCKGVRSTPRQGSGPLGLPGSVGQGRAEPPNWPALQGPHGLAGSRLGLASGASVSVHLAGHPEKHQHPHRPPRDAAGSIPTDFLVCPAGGQWAGTSEQKPIQLGKKKKLYRLVLCTPSPSVLLMLFDFLYFLML